MFSVEIHSNCSKEKFYKCRIARKNQHWVYLVSFKFKGRAISPSPGSFRVKLPKDAKTHQKPPETCIKRAKKKRQKIAKNCKKFKKKKTEKKREKKTPKTALNCQTCPNMAHNRQKLIKRNKTKNAKPAKN